MTRTEAIKRLIEIEREIGSLRRALGDGLREPDDTEATQAFLAKCGGWGDSRSAEEIVAGIYASRAASGVTPRLQDSGVG